MSILTEKTFEEMTHEDITHLDPAGCRVFHADVGNGNHVECCFKLDGSGSTIVNPNGYDIDANAIKDAFFNEILKINGE